MIVCIVDPIAHILYFEVTGLERYFMLALGLGLALFVFVLALYDFRYLSYVVVEGHLYTSYSVFNKKLYTLDINAPVYYRVFKAQQDMFYIMDFVALSNEPFEFVERNLSWFLYFYGFEEMLVMPYNDKTKPLMRLEDWEIII
jgi:hypothetical protein